MPKAKIPKQKKSKTQVPKGRFNTKREGKLFVFEVTDSAAICASFLNISDNSSLTIFSKISQNVREKRYD